jgi:hypothetical protein
MNRWLALLPLSFFGFSVWANVVDQTTGNLWWTCNLANLGLALGLVLGDRKVLMISAVFLVAGAPFWFIDAFLTNTFMVHSFFTHVVAAVMVVLILRRMSAFPAKPLTRVWPAAIALYLILQAISRLITAPGLNVNCAHAPYGWFAGRISMLAWIPLNAAVICCYGILVESGIRKIAGPFYARRGWRPRSIPPSNGPAS